MRPQLQMQHPAPQPKVPQPGEGGGAASRSSSTQKLGLKNGVLAASIGAQVGQVITDLGTAGSRTATRPAKRIQVHIDPAQVYPWHLILPRYTGRLYNLQLVACRGST